MRSILKAAGALFGTVTKVADTATKTVDIASNSLDMADRYVKNANKRHIIDSEYDMSQYAELAQMRSKIDSAEFRKELKGRLSSDPALKAEYEALGSTYDDVRAKINAQLEAL